MKIKIQYGKDIDSGEIKHISEVEKGEKANCECIGCGGKLIARKGSKQRHHFQHKSKNQCNGGSPETVLHAVGKQIIRDNHKILLYRKTFFDYTKKDIEKGMKDYTPDAIISNEQGETWLIEIAVTHFVDDDKKRKIQRDKMNCIEIELHPDLTYKNRKKIEEEVLNNPNNRKIINDPEGIFMGITDNNIFQKPFVKPYNTESKWVSFLVLVGLFLLFKKEIKRILRILFD